MLDTERRKSRRFPLQQPAILRVNTDGAHEVSAVTENASLTGVALKAAASLTDGTEVQVTTILRNGDSPHALHLRASGRVVRVDYAQGRFTLAVAFGAPLTCNRTKVDDKDQCGYTLALP